MKRTTLLPMAMALAAMAHGCATSEASDGNGASMAGTGTGGGSGFAAAGLGGASGTFGGAAGMTMVGGTTGGGLPTAGVGNAGDVALPSGGSGGVGGIVFPTGGVGGVAGMIVPAGGVGGEPPPVTTSDPVIPPVSGDCPAFTNGTITFMGLGGIQIVAGAKGASPTAPMVFYWHGTGGSSGEFALQAGAVEQAVVAEGGVLVSFQGTTGGDLLSGTLIFGAGDFAIADQLVACAVQNHNVDPHRIFATGCSAGGLFSTAMATARSNYVAAAAPNSGGWVLPVAWQSAATPALMTIHGAPGADVVVVDFSTTSATADEGFKTHGSFVINCNHGGGHCGGGSLAPNIWTFFKAHPFGVAEPWSALPAGFHSSCMIY